MERTLDMQLTILCHRASVPESADKGRIEVAQAITSDNSHVSSTKKPETPILDSVDECFGVRDAVIGIVASEVCM